MKFVICRTDVEPCPVSDLGYLSMADALDPATLGITPNEVFEVYAWGLAAVLFFYFLGYVAGVAVDAIKKA